MVIDNVLLEKALLFASNAHKGQIRKGNGQPYILHPISVAMRIKKIKKSSNFFLITICALLHDTVEDCEEVTIELIAKEFGHKVASIVSELTTNKEQCARVGKPHYLADKMYNMSSYALRLKLGDRLDNVSDYEGMSEEFRKNLKDETLYILQTIRTRKLTATHLKLIKKIKKVLNKY